MSRWRFAVVMAVAAGSAKASPLSEARTLYESRRFSQAEIAFMHLVEAEPTDDSAIYYLGKIAIRRENYPEAIHYLERAVSLAPQRSDYQLWLGNAYAWSAATAPYCDKATLGQKCLAAYRRSLELDADNVEAHFSLMNFYRHVPAFFGGGIGHAYLEANEVNARDQVLGALAFAVLSTQEKNYPRAFSLLRGLLEKDPGNYAANCAFGRLSIEANEHLSEGETRLKRCLILHPEENDEGVEKVRSYLVQISQLRAQGAIPRKELLAADGG